jgi:eukaryotic-like serine/threonine-protein kinase
MRKYQLSKKYKLTIRNAIAPYAAIEGQPNQNEEFLLLDTVSEELIVINQAMHLFLKEYETPKTLKEIAIVLASAFDSTPVEILPIAEQFLKDMKQRGVIVSPKMVERSEIIEPYAIGTLMGDYRIEAHLSSNLPLEVYKATQVQKEQPVILKVLRTPSQLSQKWREKWQTTFKKEFKIQQILRGHANICQLLNLQPDYAVLEWVEGITLRRRLVEGTPLDAQLRKALLSQILDSYAFMHKKGVLHGDVHARNILVSEDNRIKIIDFDLAHKLTKKNASPHMTGAMPEFVPPENVLFDAFNIVQGTVSPQTEVYQLGVIAYWITYGKLPFSNEVWQDMADDIVNKEADFTALASNGEPVSPDMVAFLKKSLDKKPKSRFKSAKEMKDVFELLNVW